MKPLVSKNYEKDNSDRTSLLKDRVAPNIRASGNAAIGALGGAVLGAGVGMLGKKIPVAAYKKLVASDTGKYLGKTVGESIKKNADLYRSLKKVKTPLDIWFSPEMRKVRSLAAAGTGAIALGRKGKELGRISGNVSDLKKQYQAQFGVEPSETELMEVARLNPNNKFHRKISKLFYTPNAMTKSTVRDMRQMYNGPESIGKDPMMASGYNRTSGQYPHVSNFKTSSIYSDAIEKVAVNFTYGKNLEKVLTKADKISPYIGGAVGSSLTIVPSYMFSKHLVSDDDPNRKLKSSAGTIAGSALGGTIGGVAAKDIASLSKGVVHKVNNPSETFKNGIKFLEDAIKNYKK